MGRQLWWVAGSSAGQFQVQDQRLAATDEQVWLRFGNFDFPLITVLPDGNRRCQPMARACLPLPETTFPAGQDADVAPHARFAGAHFGYKIASAAAPDYSRYANLIAKTLPTRVLGDFAEERFVAATTAATLARASARKPGLDAVPIGGVAGQPQTGQRHRCKAKAEPLCGLASRYGLRHSLG